MRGGGGYTLGIELRLVVHFVQLQRRAIRQGQRQIFEGAGNTIGKYRFAFGVNVVVDKPCALHPADGGQ
ncbi:hypothetical protein D3C77_655040 [compost metagenome]